MLCGVRIPSLLLSCSLLPQPHPPGSPFKWLLGWGALRRKGLATLSSLALSGCTLYACAWGRRPSGFQY